jgi:CHASE2 domain-containing sensor protein
MAPLWGIAVGVAAVLIYWPGVISILPGLDGYAEMKPLQSIDRRIGDTVHPWFARKVGPDEAPRICVVGVTSRGMENYGPMPWPRTKHADLVRQLDKMGARTIAFDVFFPDPAPEDDEFSEAMQDTNKVILPRWGIFPEKTPVSRPMHTDAVAAEVDALAQARPVRFPDGVFRRRLREAASDLYASSYAQGHINIFYDDDLVARRVPVAIGAPDKEKSYMPLGVVAALAYRGEDPSQAILGEKALICGNVRIPLDDSGCIVVNYQPFDKFIDTKPMDLRQVEAAVPWLRKQKRKAPVEFYAYTDVLEGRVPPEAFKDAVVLVGQCVWGSREDVHVTPYGNQFGVFVQAMLLQTTLTDNFIVPCPQWVIIASMMMLSLAVGVICFRLRYRGSTYVVLAICCLVVGAGVVATLVGVAICRRNGIAIDATPYLIVLGLNLIGGLASSAVRVGQEADRSNQAMELLLAAGERQMAEWMSSDAIAHTAVPGAGQIALSTSLAVRSPEIVAETYLQTVPCEGCIVYIVTPGESTFERRVARGFEREGLLDQVADIGGRWAAETLAAGQSAVVSRYDAEWPYKDAAPALNTMLCLPVIVHGQFMAAVVLFNKRVTPQSHERYFTSDNVRLANGLCYQAGALLENAQRYQLEYSMFEGFAQSMAKAIDVRDQYTHGHSERVAEMSKAIAAELGLTQAEQEIVHQAATLHDVGKIGVTDVVLNKPGKLTDDEFEMIRSHAAKGYEVLRSAPSFEPLLPGIRHHHERYDGRGYPDKLAGEDIPFIARIIAVADAYDAMTSDRIYRRALDDGKAHRELVGGRGTQFDPVVVDAMLRWMARFQEMPFVGQMPKGATEAEPVEEAEPANNKA